MQYEAKDEVRLTPNKDDNEVLQKSNSEDCLELSYFSISLDFANRLTRFFESRGIITDSKALCKHFFSGQQSVVSGQLWSGRNVPSSEKLVSRLDKY